MKKNEGKLTSNLGGRFNEIYHFQVLRTFNTYSREVLFHLDRLKHHPWCLFFLKSGTLIFLEIIHWKIYRVLNDVT